LPYQKESFTRVFSKVILVFSSTISILVFSHTLEISIDISIL